MVVNNIFVTNATKMSLSDRFTLLQSTRAVARHPGSVQKRHLKSFSNMRSDRIEEEMGRRLFERIATRPAAHMASVFPRRPLKYRIGTLNKPTNQRKSVFNPDRLNLSARRALPQRRGGRPRGRGSPFKGLRGKSQPRQQTFNNGGQSDTRATGSQIRGNRRGTRRRGVFRNQTANQNASEISNTFSPSGRGRGNNQRRGINRSWFAQKGPTPTKEELDKQLDLYMSGTRSQLDRELDIYMSNVMDVE